jgi:hypothetical protein
VFEHDLDGDGELQERKADARQPITAMKAWKEPKKRAIETASASIARPTAITITVIMLI